MIDNQHIAIVKNLIPLSFARGSTNNQEDGKLRADRLLKCKYMRCYHQSFVISAHADNKRNFSVRHVFKA
jgi:hypothetical protein